MAEVKVGDEFITHEFDEAIAIQRAIVEAETQLAKTHPVSSAKKAISEALTEDKSLLSELEDLGEQHDASGEVEEVAAGLKSLLEETVEAATEDGAPSDYYEAHAVLLNAKRKQMDSAGGMLEIAKAMRDQEFKTAATKFGRAQKASSEVLAKELAGFAAQIASVS